MGRQGKDGNNRRNRHRYSGKKNESPHRQDFDRSKDSGHNARKAGGNLLEGGKLKRSHGLYERPLWTAPKAPDEPIPVYNCPWCDTPIKDISTAISDKTSGLPVHFDCVIARLGKTEMMGANDAICYIGGGRFGLIQYNNPPDTTDFRIKKIFEWEDKDNRGDWRRNVSEHFSVT